MGGSRDAVTRRNGRNTLSFDWGTRTRFLQGLLALFTICASVDAFAEESESGELVEKVAVKNRLYSVEGRWEVGANVGFTLVPRLTDHTNFNASVAYNVMETLAIELRGGYALSRHTGLAEDLANKVRAGITSTTTTKMTETSGMWELNGHAVVGARWQPIYGKLSLVSDLAVHFQFYAWAGAGVGFFRSESIILCNKTYASSGGCYNYASGSSRILESGYYESRRAGPLASLALGFRFFVTPKHSIKFEFRDWSYLDSYYTDIDPRAALSPATPTGNGKLSSNPGIINLVQFDAGYSFIF